MTRLLAGFVWDGTCGGIDAYLVAFARLAASEGVRVDFLTNEYAPGFAAKLEEMGHRLYEIATLHDRRSQRSTIEALNQKNDYDAAYFNVSTALMLPVVQAAHRAGIARVVVHAHAAGNDQASPLRRAVFDAGNALFRPALRRAASLMVACSSDAGRWLFGNKALSEGRVHVVPNPVDTRSCAFDPAVRERMRERLDVKDRYVVGSVTAMKAIKNPLFMVEAFARFRDACENAVLVVAGDGELADEVRRHAELTLPAGSWRLLGKREDVPALLQAFDCFMLTSLKEGLSIATIEAQSAGLPCLVSTGVPKEASAAPPLVRRLPLSAGPQAWAGELGRLWQTRRDYPSTRQGWVQNVEAAGYSADSPLAVLRMIESLVRESI